jgi:Rap guanine nucleotide exchange factor 1
VTTFADNLPIEQDPRYGKLADQIRAAILKRTMGNKTVGKRGLTMSLAKLHQLPEPILTVPKKKVEKGIPLNLWDYDELEIARQLTIIDFMLFAEIRPQELLGQAWMKAKHKAQNVLQMISRANDVSLWVCGLILSPARAKVRALRFAKLIRIAGCLRDLNNYSTLMAFLGGFNNSAIFRLNFTKKYIPKKEVQLLDRLEAVMAVEKSFAAYRAALHGANPPVIPYMGCYLSDLTFTDEGNPDEINGLINFGKRLLVYRCIDEIKRFQQVPYLLKQVDAVTMHVRDIPCHDESYDKVLYEQSMQREPRGAERVP